MKSSINIQTAKLNANNHMDRVSKVTYLIQPNSKNNEYQTFLNENSYLQKCMIAAKEKTGRKMQKSAVDNFRQEAVLNLTEKHTLENVKNAFKNLQKRFGGFAIFKIAVHKDEGYFFNKKDKIFYLDKDFNCPADMNDFEKRFNYHAHVTFTKFDISKGKNARLNKSDMRDMQTSVADSLKMVRGQFNSQVKRMSHWQLKVSHDIKRAERKNTNKIKSQAIDSIQDRNKKIAEQKRELESISKYEFRAMQQQITALKDLTAEQKKELHKMNTKARKDEKIQDELQEKINSIDTYTQELSISNYIIPTDKIETVKKHINVIESKNKKLYKENLELSNKSNHAQDTVVLKEEIDKLKEDNKLIEIENYNLKAMLSKIFIELKCTANNSTYR